MFTFFVNYILDYIPTWMWPILAGGGVTVFFFAGLITYFPSLSIYAKLIKPVSFLVICLSFFMWGGAGVQDVYQAALAIHEAKVAAAEQSSKDANRQLGQVLKLQNQLILQKSNTIANTIKNESKLIDKECNIDSATITLYNSMVTNALTAPTGVNKK